MLCFKHRNTNTISFLVTQMGIEDDCENYEACTKRLMVRKYGKVSDFHGLFLIIDA